MSDLYSYPPIMSFAGPKFAGKGTATRLLLAAGYVQISFARPLKDMLLAMGLTEEDVNDPARKEQPHPLLGDKTPRWALQSLGTNWAREMIYNDIWVGIARHRILQARESGMCVVVDDCRFNNEAQMLRALGSPIIEITRLGCAYNAGHASEAGLSRELIDFSVANDGTPEDLHARLDALLRGCMEVEGMLAEMRVWPVKDIA